MHLAAVLSQSCRRTICACQKLLPHLDQHSSVALPPEALDALGIEAGAELEVEIVGRALVVRSVDEARR